MGSESELKWGTVRFIDGQVFQITESSYNQVAEVLEMTEQGFEEPPEFLRVETTEGAPAHIRVSFILSLTISTRETRLQYHRNKQNYEQEHEELALMVRREGQGPQIHH